MKKILLLIIIIFMTGCYDYHEINETAIVCGIGLDYQDDYYILTYEILNIKSNSEDINNNEKKYIVEDKGKSIIDAVSNIERKISINTSYSHVLVLLVSKNILNDKLLDVSDYFIRDNKLSY